MRRFFLSPRRLCFAIGIVIFIIILISFMLPPKGDDGIFERKTLYEYYTEEGIEAGLEVNSGSFQLNKKNITLFCGAIHYFRVHPQYWRDRLRKLRAAGFNAVETFVPWNLHEPQQGMYDFGEGGNDMSVFLNIVKFINIAQDEDLFVIIRPGPYIGAEWEFGGLPSWLLRFPGLRIRSSESQFLERVRKYFSQLFPLFRYLQFTRGGPIIAFQIENKFTQMKNTSNLNGLKYRYLEFLEEQFKEHYLMEMLFTSDEIYQNGRLPGVLHTITALSGSGKLQLNWLKSIQPDSPLMVMEYKSGHFHHWLEQHKNTSISDFRIGMINILSFPASFSLYMFHGGTNFGFYNGANVRPGIPHYRAVVTSYDYDAPITEAGDYTRKYYICKKLIWKYNQVPTRIPYDPEESIKRSYKAVHFTEQMDYERIVHCIGPYDREKSDKVKSIEQLTINEGNGQSYGYVIYRSRVLRKSLMSLEIKNGTVQDVAIVLLDNKNVLKNVTLEDQLKDSKFWQKPHLIKTDSSEGTGELDILVENWSRVSDGKPFNFDQCKGLREGTKILMNGEELRDWEIMSLQFKSKWVNSLTDWTPYVHSRVYEPKLVRGILEVDIPSDTFIDMSGWGRGVVFINGFNLGRYFSKEHPHTLYLPAPLLKKGDNDIIVFEFIPSQRRYIMFLPYPMFS